MNEFGNFLINLLQTETYQNEAFGDLNVSEWTTINECLQTTITFVDLTTFINFNTFTESNEFAKSRIFMISKEFADSFHRGATSLLNHWVFVIS